MAINKPMIVVVGPTASGKSRLALQLAGGFKGEIICADARTIYKGMNIGTAKPTKAEQEQIPHHLLDIAEPNQAFSVADFKAAAVKAIDDIHKRGKLPIMAGGTGLYIDAVLFDFAFRPVAEPKLRKQLENMTVGQLQADIKERGLPMPENAQNPRHLVRTLETEGAVPERKPLRANTLIVGIDITKDVLLERIQTRIKEMINVGLEKEVANLAEKYGWEAPGLTAIGYREWEDSFDNELRNSSEVTEQIVHDTLMYAKRQMTWFRRNKSIHWLTNPSGAVDITTEFLNKEA